MVRNTLNQYQTVLVTGGAGALGQAVISLCLASHCTVYATVSDIRKKEFLMKMFPKLKEENISSSRIFRYPGVGSLDARKFRCNYIINCANPSMWKKATRFLDSFGVYIDVTNHNMSNYEDFNMSTLIEETVYQRLTLSSIFMNEYFNEKKRLQQLMAEGISKGAVKPISWVTYSPEDVTKAFRFLSQSKNRGRVLLNVGNILQLQQSINILPRLSLPQEKIYVIVGDKANIAVPLVDRLITRGATKIIFNHKKSGFLDAKCTKWSKNNVLVTMTSENLTHETGWQNLLKICECAGMIQGIYIVENENSIHFQEIVSSTGNCDSNAAVKINYLIKTQCPKLSHFAVVNISYINQGRQRISLYESIFKLRIADKLSATLIRHELNDVNSDNLDDILLNIKGNDLSEILDKVESSLIGHELNETTDGNTKLFTNWRKKIENIIGTTFYNLEDHLMLGDLCMNEIILQEIKHHIEIDAKLYYTLSQIRYMTLSDFKAVIDHGAEQNPILNTGLKAFFSYFNDDECAAAERIVSIPTKCVNPDKMDEEFDSSETYLLLVPGYEGHSDIFTSLCKLLKLQAISIQFGTDFLEETVEDLAKSIIQNIRNAVQLKSKFYILGYSFGVNIALELAALIEKEGHTGVVYCLDSSPDVLKTQLNTYLGDIEDDKLQNTIIKHMFYLMTGKHGDDVLKELKYVDNWNKKIEFCMQKIKGLVSYSKDYMHSIIYGAYVRIKAARTYEPSFKLDSEIILLKSIPYTQSKKMTQDYNLSQYTKQPVKVFDIESDHQSASRDCKVANIINRFLDLKMIKKFETNIFCECYNK